MIPELLFGVLFGCGMVAAAAFDLASRRVPNGLNVSILIVGLFARGAFGGLESVGQGALGVGIGLAIGLVPFALRVVGGGDVKLVAAAGAWLGVGVVPMVVVGAAGGGVLALVVLATGGRALRREVGTNLLGAVYARRAPVAPQRTGRQVVPLAVALGGAGIAVFVWMGGLHG